LKIWKRLVRRLSGHVWAPEDEAAWMIQARTGRSVFRHPFHLLQPEDVFVLLSWTEGRKRGRPLGYLTGRAFFWGRPLRVASGVFIPRPESEALVAALLERTEDRNLRVVDLGTGSGALLLAFLLERPHAQGLGVDRSLQALEVARQNAQQWGLSHRVRWIRADAGRLPLPDASVDVLLANPPYVPDGWVSPDPAVAEEPREALYSPGGVEHFRIWLQEALRVLRPGGVGGMECSSVVAEPIRTMFEKRGMVWTFVPDASGEVRGVVFQKSLTFSGTHFLRSSIS